eukprot:COSAG02_NODE_1839_length_10707_cov_7.098793_6_plen_83_part_00
MLFDQNIQARCINQNLKKNEGKLQSTRAACKNVIVLVDDGTSGSSHAADAVADAMEYFVEAVVSRQGNLRTPTVGNQTAVVI